MADFIIDNQILFIVLGILIIMAIIGYFAEKYNLGNKVNKPQKKEKEEAKKFKEESVEIIEEKEPTDFNFEIESTEDQLADSNEVTLEPAIQPVLAEEIEDTTNEDLTISLTGIQNEMNVEAVASELGVDPEILTTPLEGNIVSDEYGIDNVPSLHADSKSTESQDNGEDVWKF